MREARFYSLLTSLLLMIYTNANGTGHEAPDPVIDPGHEHRLEHEHSLDDEGQGAGLTSYIASLKGRFPGQVFDTLAVVKVAHQRLYFIKNSRVYKSYPISTSRYGIGSDVNSLRTPLGMHRIRSKIGDGEPLGTIFKARVPTGESISMLREDDTERHDLVTTRIMWLDGLEAGRNQGDGVDSYERYIYIHGTHEEDLIGQPASQGCVRMRNTDVVELYDQLPEGAPVLIMR